jgi:hypothetical protein
MRNRIRLLILPLLVSGVACQPTVNTIPPVAGPMTPVQYYDLQLPRDLEVKAVDFTATTYADVSGVNGMTSSSVAGRAFVKVYAVHRTTGEQFLLLYEDIAHRAQPAQIIRFRFE